MQELPQSTILIQSEHTKQNSKTSNDSAIYVQLLWRFEDTKYNTVRRCCGSFWELLGISVNQC